MTKYRIGETSIFNIYVVLDEGFDGLVEDKPLLWSFLLVDKERTEFPDQWSTILLTSDEILKAAEMIKEHCAIQKETR